MKFKEIFKTIEGLAMVAAFTMIILTGLKIFAWVGLAAYVVINLAGGLKTVRSIWNKIFKKDAKK